MKIIEPKVELLPSIGIDKSDGSIYSKMISRVAEIARLCYRSERSADDIDRDYEFTHGLYVKGHTSVFEHVRFNFEADALIPSWDSYDTAKKMAETNITANDKKNLKMTVSFNKARGIFCDLIRNHINRTSVGKEMVNIYKCHEDSLSTDGAYFSFMIYNINLRELIEIFDEMTFFIGNYAGHKYCEKEFGLASFWTTPNKFHIECMSNNDDVEFILFSLAVSLWRSIYIKFSDCRSDRASKNIFESISNKQEFYHEFTEGITKANVSEILESFTESAKKMISNMKSDVAYKKYLTFAMSYMSSSRGYKEIEHVKVIIPNGYLTFYIETNRGVLAELTRHRCLSPTVESTRYVNYSNTGKYGEMCFTDQISLYEPDKNDSLEDVKKNKKKQRLLRKMYAKEERMYNKLIKNGFIPQEARNVLPNGLVSRMYVTGRYDEWGSFVRLRSHKTAHPDIKVISDVIKEYVREIENRTYR